PSAGEASSLQTLAATPEKAKASSRYRRPGTWPPQKAWHWALQSAMQIWKVGAWAHRFWQMSVAGGASQAASHTGFAQRPGSCVPSASETPEPISISFPDPSEFCSDLRKLA